VEAKGALHVLVLLDFSKPSEKALEFAASDKVAAKVGEASGRAGPGTSLKRDFVCSTGAAISENLAAHEGLTREDNTQAFRLRLPGDHQ
jgi:hypothetical protein